MNQSCSFRSYSLLFICIWISEKSTKPQLSADSSISLRTPLETLPDSCILSSLYGASQYFSCFPRAVLVGDYARNDKLSKLKLFTAM